MKVLNIETTTKRQAPAHDDAASQRLDSIQAVLDELHTWPEGKDKDKAIAQYQTYLNEAERRVFGY